MMWLLWEAASQNSTQSNQTEVTNQQTASMNTKNTLMVTLRWIMSITYSIEVSAFVKNKSIFKIKALSYARIVDTPIIYSA